MGTNPEIPAPTHDNPGVGMKRIALAAMALFVWMATAALAAEPGTIEFCEGFNDRLEPVKAGTEFPGPSISWVATAAKPYGKPIITLTIYKVDGQSEILLERRSLDVNPDWDVTALRNMPLQDEGEYKVALTSTDGEAIASGKVKITRSATERPASPEEVLGATMKALFQKYAPKK